MKTKTMLTLGLILLLAAAYGYGQQPSRLLKANIPFPFKAADKALPAGDYEITYDVAGDAFRVKGGGQDGLLVPVITRLAGGIHTTPNDAHLVFDKVGDTYTLSEAWYPVEDGFLLMPTKGAHTHGLVTVTYTVSPNPAPEKP